MGTKLGPTQPVNGIPQTLLTPPPGASDKQPSFVRFSAGHGQVLLSAGEWLDAVDPEPLRHALTDLFSPARWLTFTPDSTWLEYMVQYKNDTWVFPLFNHGRGSFPSKNGVDHVPWTGTIRVDLDKLGAARRLQFALKNAVYARSRSFLRERIATFDDVDS